MAIDNDKQIEIPDNYMLVVNWEGHCAEIRHHEGVVVVDGTAWTIESLVLMGSSKPMTITFWTKNGRRNAVMHKRTSRLPREVLDG